MIAQKLPYWFLHGQPLNSDYTYSKTESKNGKQRGIIAMIDMIDMYEFHIFELWDKEINATQKIIPVKYATYTFVKRKPEKFRLARIGTPTSVIPVQGSN